MLRRLWTCSVALLEKGCKARRDCVTLGRRDGGTGARQSHRRQAGLHKWGNSWRTPIHRAGSVAPRTKSMVLLELPLKTLGTRPPRHTVCIPHPLWGPHPGTSPHCSAGTAPAQHGTHMGASQQLLHDVMVKDVAAPDSSLLLRVQLLILLDLAKAQLPWQRGTPPPGLHYHGEQPSPNTGTGYARNHGPSPSGYHLPRAPDGYHVPWVPRASPPSPLGTVALEYSASSWYHVCRPFRYQILPPTLLMNMGVRPDGSPHLTSS